jgi:hypothetical protein
MKNPETVEISDTTTLDTNTKQADTLDVQQQSDVSAMRSALLNCDRGDAASVSFALQTIFSMRVFHQISKLIKYTEQMDKIEQKMYASMDNYMSTMDETDTAGWLVLIEAQERLQRIMMNSQKLLEPYTNVSLYIPEQPVEDSFGNGLLDQNERKKLRESAQLILDTLKESEEKDG